MALKYFTGTNFKPCRGMSFAEIIVAIAILSSVLLTMIGVFIGGLEALQKGTAYNYAVLVARRTIENYRMMDYSSVPIYDPPDITYEGDFLIETGIVESTYSTTTIGFKRLSVTVKNADVAKVSDKVKVNITTYLFPYHE